MTAFLDTSVVLRYLTGHPPHLAVVAAEIIDGAGDLWVTATTVGEAFYVLTRVYDVERRLAVETLIAFLEREQILSYAIDKDYLLQGLRFALPSGRVAIADALIWATARSAGADGVYTFDQRFPSEGMPVLQSLT